MGSEQVNPLASGVEPELHLLITDKQFEEPLYKSLFRELDEFFFPKKLPPLKLESKPEPVRDIWGFYDYKKNGVLGRLDQNNSGSVLPRQPHHAVAWPCSTF